MITVPKHAYIILICGKYPQQWSVKKFLLADKEMRQQNKLIKSWIYPFRQTEDPNYFQIDSTLRVKAEV